MEDGGANSVNRKIGPVIVIPAFSPSFCLSLFFFLL